MALFKVVLPVVARKKGLDGHYEKADGGPRPLKPSRVEPVRTPSCSAARRFADHANLPQAPGTFGFDYSKYRPSPDGGQDIQMDEFGRQPIDGIAEEEDRDGEQERRSVRDGTSGSARTPVPASQRRPGDEARTMGLNGGGVPKGHPRQDEDETGPGCCKCVIM